MESSVVLAQPRSLFNKILPWLVWGVSSLFVTYQMLLQTAPSVMIADLEQTFSINSFGVSLLSSSFFYTYVLLQIPAGMLVDRVSPRYCLMFCLLGVAAMTIVFATSHSLEVARWSRILQGVFSAPSVVPALYLAALWFPARQFALLAGLTEMIGMLGSAIGQVTLAPCSGWWGWRSTLLCCAGIGFAMAILTWTIVRDRTEGTKSNATSREPCMPVWHSLWTVIACPQAWISGLVCGLLFSVSAAFAAFWCIPFLMNVYGLSLNMAATASSMVLFGVALGAPTLGWISDYVGKRCLPMVISTALVTGLMLAVLYVPLISLLPVLILLFCLGFFSSAYAVPFAMMRDIMPDNVRGTAMGFMNMMCIAIGSPIFQPLIGWLLHHPFSQLASRADLYREALSVLPVGLGIALVLTCLMKETRCSPAGSA